MADDRKQQPQGQQSGQNPQNKPGSQQPGKPGSGSQQQPGQKGQKPGTDHKHEGGKKMPCC